MSSGSRKRRKKEREEEIARKRQFKDATQHNPSGGSKYAKKGDKPFSERVAAEMDRRAADMASKVGAPVDENRDLLLVDNWGESTFGLYDFPDASEADLMRRVEERAEARQNETPSSRRRRFADFDF